MHTHPPQSFPTEPPEPVVAQVPPLEAGDSLTRPEFERRYEAMPWLKKAELIDGVVFMGSPVKEPHATAHVRLLIFLGLYAEQTPTVSCADNVTVRLDLQNEVQPDALLRIVSGGQSRTGSDGYVEGPPEFVAEVASSSVSRDLHSKLTLYHRHGVCEYLVWRVLESDLDWFRLEDGEYRRTAADEQGIFRSQVFPGLWLDKPALLRGDMAAVLATLNQGLASPEHIRFASVPG